MARDPERLARFRREASTVAGLNHPNARSALQNDTGHHATPHSGSSANSAAIRVEEGFRVAVLPFKHKGANPELDALAEGITDEIITGLSRFSYLRVIARSSTERFSSGDVRTIGKELGARYLMEGSLRQAGSRPRELVSPSENGWNHTCYPSSHVRSRARNVSVRSPQP